MVEKFDLKEILKCCFVKNLLKICFHVACGYLFNPIIWQEKIMTLICYL